ncbi:UNVERIFIED_CONTAM: hypothetical protein GTU68_025163 [Idotea baltica]|nr:hypothetical protein [Idotea baltica]
MPKMDGFEFIKTLNQHPKFKYIPVVVMSTSDNKIDLERCYELGVSGYFTKPLKYSDYIKNVTSLLEYWQKTTYLKE